MKTITSLLIAFITLISMAQVSEKDLDQVKFQKFVTEDGVTTHSFSMGEKLIGPSHSFYPDGMKSYTYFGDGGMAQGFQMVENPSTGVQVLQMMRDNLKHGNSFKLTGSQINYAQTYKNDEIYKVMEVPYTTKSSNRANCLGNCINGFGLFAAGGDQMVMGYFWAENPKSPIIHSFPGGSEYKGEMDKWNREGFGKYKWKSGEYYVGMWKKNKRHGQNMGMNNS